MIRWFRRPGRMDPYEILEGDAGRATRRVRTLTLGRMRPPDRLVRRAAGERRRQIGRFFAALEAVHVASGRPARPGSGFARVDVYGAASFPGGETRFWVVDDTDRLKPDPSTRRGLTPAELREELREAVVELTATDRCPPVVRALLGIGAR